MSRLTSIILSAQGAGGQSALVQCSPLENYNSLFQNDCWLFDYMDMFVSSFLWASSTSNLCHLIPKPGAVHAVLYLGY